MIPRSPKATKARLELESSRRHMRGGGIWPAAPPWWPGAQECARSLFVRIAFLHCLFALLSFSRSSNSPDLYLQSNSFRTRRGRHLVGTHTHSGCWPHLLPPVRDTPCDSFKDSTDRAWTTSQCVGKPTHARTHATANECITEQPNGRTNEQNERMSALTHAYTYICVMMSHPPRNSPSTYT